LTNATALGSYLQQFLQLPLRKLIGAYAGIELRLLDEIGEIVVQRLRDAGFHPTKESYARAHRRVRVFREVIGAERRLLISVKEPEPTVPYRDAEASVEHFGLIRTVTVVYPEYLPFSTLAVDVATHAQAAYAALEQAFIANAHELHSLVFRNIYDCIEAQLANAGKLRHFGRIWLFVGEEPLGNYYFDEAVIRRVITHYKLHQREIISPVEFTTWIMSVPIPYAKSLGIRSFHEGKPLSQQWTHVEYRNDAERIFDAEVALFGSESFTSYTPAKKGKYYLNLACPAEIAADVIPEVQRIEPVLEAVFERGLREWSPYVKLLRRVTRGIGDQPIIQVASRIIGGAAAEFVKEIGKV
jgi:hypothetical protein